MARSLPSPPEMLPESSGKVLSTKWLQSREDEVAVGKVGEDSCHIDFTHGVKQ